MERNVELDDHGRRRRTADDSGRALVWDCGSALYDSYELAAVKHHLDAALLATCHRRSLSMPHLPAEPARAAAGGKPARRGGQLPALLRRLFSKVLRLRPPLRERARYDHRYFADDGCSHGNSGAGSPWSGALTSIPEESASPPEKGPAPADAGRRSVLRKAQSERFVSGRTASSLVQFEVVL